MREATGSHRLQGHLAAADIRRVLQRAEPGLSLTVPSWAHRNGTDPDIFIAAAVLTPGLHTAEDGVVDVGPLGELLARFAAHPVVGRPDRTLRRLFLLNVSDAWRLMVARAEAAGIDLGLSQAAD
jgi:hypothetical protein